MPDTMPYSTNAIANYAAVAEAVTAYCEATHGNDVARIEALAARIWSRKTITSDGGVVRESRAQLLDRIRLANSESPRPTHLSSIQLCFRDFAIARADEWEGPASSILLLFQERGVWKVAGEANVLAGAGTRPRHFSVSDAERQVLDVLAIYYKAVTEGSPDAVRANEKPRRDSQRRISRRRGHGSIRQATGGRAAAHLLGRPPDQRCPGDRR